MHDEYCNCEDCWWSRDCREICPVCGCIIGGGCPGCNTEDDTFDHGDMLDIE